VNVPIRISRLHFPVTTLGPGNRVGIWFQGCSIQCPGCISADTWGTGRGMTTIDSVMALVDQWLPCADGITVSGGEPFDQQESLISLLTEIRSRSQIDILVFSGYKIEKLAPVLGRATGLIDALISDPFDQKAPQTKALRGSDNQRLHLLTHTGAERFACYERPHDRGDRALDVMFDDDGSIWLAGIPRRHDLDRLQTILASEGHALSTSAHRSTPTEVSDQR
jgi:anaerobic ribonucleoside-triphosphate reductase activating protein